jgi:PAS domain-containing protein
MREADRWGRDVVRVGGPRDHTGNWSRELIAALDWSPLASLIVADDGTMLAANRAWTDLSGTASTTTAGAAGWLSAVESTDRAELRSRLQTAAAIGETGFTDVRLTGASRNRWTRWWWRPAPGGYVVVCVAEFGIAPNGVISHSRPGAGHPAGGRHH